LPEIDIPLENVSDGMVLFNGAERFSVGSDQLPGALRHERSMPPFYLDVCEMSVGDYLNAWEGPAPYFPHFWPRDLRQDPPPLDHAVTLVRYDEAVHFAEKIGKRLPDEFEFEFAATEGGRSRFPWGNDGSRLSAE
jgi:formylglycine-generating enzyme required for sulfatase activity